MLDESVTFRNLHEFCFFSYWLVENVPCLNKTANTSHHFNENSSVISFMCNIFGTINLCVIKK
jgi:hypothetical protein